MSGLGYKKYYFIGNALTETEFLELKNLFQVNRNLVEAKYKVGFLKEIFHEFKFQFLLILMAGTVAALFQIFLPDPTGVLLIILIISIITVFYGVISLALSMFYFLLYLGNKQRYGKIHLYLLENSPAFKSYMESYLKAAP
jgi:hypothetical protein